MIPLVLLHIPALVAYVTSQYALQDAFQRRQNACAVLDEFIKYVKCAPDDLQKAVEKCKGPVKCPGSYTSKTLAALHDALSKNTPCVERPVEDAGCDLDAWNTEGSMIREIFGTQLSNGKHVLAFELEAAGNSLTKCLNAYLDKANATVTRPPLVMICNLPHKKFVDYPFEFEFSAVKYVLKVVATAGKTMFDDNGQWYTHDGGQQKALQTMNDLVDKEARVLVYRRF